MLTNHKVLIQYSSQTANCAPGAPKIGKRSQCDEAKADSTLAMLKCDILNAFPRAVHNPDHDAPSTVPLVWTEKCRSRGVELGGVH